MANIKGTNVAAPIVPFTTDDQYPSYLPEYGRGGKMEMPDAAARDAIPMPRRNTGMFVTTQNDGKTYQLKGGVANSNWVELEAGAASADKPLPQGRGIVWLGDSQTQPAYWVETVSSIMSDDNGIVTITKASGLQLYTPGDRIRIINAAPTEFNGEFEVESVMGTTAITIKNSRVAANTTAGKDWSSPGGPALAQQTSAGTSYVHYAIAKSGVSVPIVQIWALTSSQIWHWSSRLDDYVYPTRAEYVFIALGGNDATGGTAEQTMLNYGNLIDQLLLHDMKPICCKIYPRNEDISSAGNQRIIAINAWLEKYCAARNIPVIDFYSPLLNADESVNSQVFMDTVHVTTEGHQILGEILATRFREIFAQTDLLPVSAVQNVASGTNVFDDPLITKAPATASGNVTGQHGAETKVTVSNGTAVASIEAREDGYGNNIKVAATFTATGNLTFTTSRTQTVTVNEYSVVFPIFALDVEGEAATTVDCTWTSSKNGAASRMFVVIPSLTRAPGNFVGRGEPVYLRAGDSISGVSIAAKVNSGAGSVIAKFGRVMACVMPYDKWRALQTIAEATITQATDVTLGGIRAKARTTETVEAAIDSSSGKLYVSATQAAEAAWGSLTGQPTDNGALTTLLDTRIGDINEALEGFLAGDDTLNAYLDEMNETLEGFLMGVE